MQFTIGVVSGVLLGAILLMAARREAPAARPAWPAWLTLALGIAAAAAFAIGMIGVGRIPALMWMAIALPAAAVVLGGGSLIRGDRRWPTWAGFICGLLPALFWVIFAVGEVFGPPH